MKRGLGIGLAATLTLIVFALTIYSMPVSAQSNSPCAGFTTRLRVGITARVTPGDPNNVRAQPSTTAQRRGQIPGGASFSVIGGPRCAGGYTWWQVRYGSIEGWTAEASTSGTYWVEPVSGSGGGGVGGGTGSAGSGGTGGSGRSDRSSLPADIEQGIVFAGTGGASATTICFSVDPAGQYPAITSGIGAFQMLDDAVYPNGTFFGLRNPEGNLSNVLDQPGICTAFNVSASDVRLIDPFGQTSSLSPIIWNYPNSEPGAQIQLPLEAYIQPGTWTIQLGDFVVYVEVPESTEFVLYQYLDKFEGLRTYRNLDVQTYALVGLPANEQIAIIDSEAVAILTTDSNGYALHTTPRNVGIAAVVAQNGEVYPMGISLEVPNRYRIPDDQYGQVLYDIAWNGLRTLTTWTCSGALPIRLSEDGQGRVVSNGLNIYDEATLSAGVVTVASQGQVVEIIDGIFGCADGLVWWTVDVGLTFGFIPESGNGQYFLEPA
jgi:hypothetical protein